MQKKSKTPKKKEEFEWFPKKKKKYRRPKAKKLQDFLEKMMIVHALFAVMELFFYDLQLTMFMFELLYMYVCYRAYMSLSKCWQITYLILMV